MRAVASPPSPDSPGLTLLDIAAVLLQSRRMIVALGLTGATLGLISGLTSERVYQSSATFVPQASDGGTSGLALAASQFGLQLPGGSGGAWGPPVYVELLRSRTLLEQVAADTVIVAELGNRRMRVLDLLNVKGATPAEVGENAFIAMSGVVQAGEIKQIGGVGVSVTTPWPSVSYALANRVVQAINDFILQTRTSAAAAERQFVDEQAREAEVALRRAEDRLLAFQQRNRIAAGAAQVERDRLAREVERQEAIYSALLQGREDAKIREVRDTPVITVLEEPRLPHTSEPRGTVVKVITGGMAGGLVAVVVALLGWWYANVRRGDEADSEFFRQLDQLKPRFLRKRA